MSAVLLSLAYQSLWQAAIAAQPRRDISATADPRKPPEVESNLRRSLVRLQDDGGRHDIDPKAKLVEVLNRTEEYIDIATNTKDRCEREALERIVEQYLKIAEELEALMDR